MGMDEWKAETRSIGEGELEKTSGRVRDFHVYYMFAYSRL